MIRTLSLLPATGLETAIGVDEEQLVREYLEHGGNTVTDLLIAGHTGRVDIVDTRPNLVGVAVLLEGVEQLHVALRRLDGDDISIKTLDGWEDVVEVGVAEVRVGLERVGDTSSGELERREGPVEVRLPVGLAKREL